jgi:hypothetical protein
MSDLAPEIRDPGEVPARDQGYDEIERDRAPRERPPRPAARQHDQSHSAGKSGHHQPEQSSVLMTLEIRLSGSELGLDRLFRSPLPSNTRRPPPALPAPGRLGRFVASRDSSGTSQGQAARSRNRRQELADGSRRDEACLGGAGASITLASAATAHSTPSGSAPYGAQPSPGGGSAGHGCVDRR